MPIFAFYAAIDAHRRPDGLNFALVEGADEATARAAAAAMIGAPGIDDWTAVPIAAGFDPVVVQGSPVGKPDNATWPDRTRGNRQLNS